MHCENAYNQKHTFLYDVDAGVVEKEIAETVALRVDVRFPAEASRLEEFKCLQTP
jgi:hypothetical protein